MIILLVLTFTRHAEVLHMGKNPATTAAEKPAKKQRAERKSVNALPPPPEDSGSELSPAPSLVSSLFGSESKTPVTSRHATLHAGSTPLRFTPAAVTDLMCNDTVDSPQNRRPTIQDEIKDEELAFTRISEPRPDEAVGVLPTDLDHAEEQIQELCPCRTTLSGMRLLHAQSSFLYPGMVTV